MAYRLWGEGEQLQDTQPRFSCGSIFGFHHAIVSGADLGWWSCPSHLTQTETPLPQGFLKLRFFCFWCKSLIIFLEIWTCSLSQSTDDWVRMIDILMRTWLTWLHVLSRGTRRSWGRQWPCWQPSKRPWRSLSTCVALTVSVLGMESSTDPRQFASKLFPVTSTSVLELYYKKNHPSAQKCFFSGCVSSIPSSVHLIFVFL